MSEILSQNEIDELFKALNTGELDVTEMNSTSKKKVIKPYDFARPSKFSKEQLRTLEIICENYGRIVSNYLSGYLRTMIPVEVINSEAITYSEFTNALSNPVILSIVNFSPLNGSIIIELSANMGYAIIDRILGGEGRSLHKVREFTEIERMILERIFGQFVNLLIEPWENVVQLNPTLEKIETNSQVVQIIPPNEMVALITFNLKLGDLEGMMNLCIPHMVIESIMDKLNTKYWFSQKEQELGPSYGQYIENMIGHSRIPVKAVLGKTHITIQEFLELQRDDIIKLDKNIDSGIDVYVGNLLKFKAKPGAYKNRAAIKIESIIQREDE
ncbi:MAG: flagellar motor switch protein FliM [Cellulosilyticaceae bacterium]